MKYSKQLAALSKFLALLLLAIPGFEAMPYRSEADLAPYQPSMDPYLHGRHQGYEDSIRRNKGNPGKTPGYIQGGSGYLSSRTPDSYSEEKPEKKERKGENNNEETEQTETKYYYGGKFTGSCTVDGLYYRDDTTFVICSNGYPHAQPCPPGTRTSGFPRYRPGFYYGYTDLCSVNLVDFGYGPEYYAPKGPPKDDDDDDDANDNGKNGKKRGKYNNGYSSGSSASSSYGSASSAPYYGGDQGLYSSKDSRLSPSDFRGYSNQPTIENNSYPSNGRRSYPGGQGQGLHYSNHLGQNKQGGAGYGAAKMAEPQSEFQSGQFSVKENNARNAGMGAYKF